METISCHGGLSPFLETIAEAAQSISSKEMVPSLLEPSHLLLSELCQTKVIIWIAADKFVLTEARSTYITHNHPNSFLH